MKTLVIAECGVNHNGSEEEAYKLIDAAVYARADVAKFQIYKPELLTDDIGKLEMLQSLLLTREAYVRLWQYCKDAGIGFACTAFDADSLRFLLDSTNMEFVKISSGQGANEALIEVAENAGMMVIQSIPPPRRNLRFNYGWRYLHVVPLYPTTPEEANLQILQCSWCSGLSDHSGDIFMPLAAVALGAQIIECHITLNKNADGPDHKASLDPIQFKEMVRGIRAIEQGLK